MIITEGWTIVVWLGPGTLNTEARWRVYEVVSITAKSIGQVAAIHSELQKDTNYLLRFWGVKMDDAKITHALLLE